MEKLRVASLFCGCGGTDVGLLGNFDFLGKHYDSNGMEIVYANDIDDNACNIFKENFKITPDSRDIREVKSEELPEFDILTGGFPCQSFSIIAQNPKRLGVKDERGKLFFEMCRILRERQPKCFIAENVKGILTGNKKSAFPLIIKEFEDSGYDVQYRILNSADYGVPQNINKPCNTVGAHLAKVSLNSTDPVLMQGSRYRRFTPREVARIQSFPDEFELVGSETAQYRALGNAIPPVMFWYVARAVKEELQES